MSKFGNLSITNVPASRQMLDNRGESLYFKHSALILLAFSSAFFSRILDTFGAPSSINFLHFLLIPLTCGIIMTQSKIKNRTQIQIARTIIIGLVILLSIMLVSAALNGAGMINVILDFLLLGEPFLLLIAIICMQMTIKSLRFLQIWITRFCLLHIILALIQHHIIIPFFPQLIPNSSLGPMDLVQGIFFVSGSGHTVGASVSILFGLYFFNTFKSIPLLIRLIVVLATIWQLVISDAKQIIVVMIAAWILLSIFKLQNLRRTLFYLIGIIISLASLLWCIENFEVFSPFRYYLDPTLYSLDSTNFQLKTASLRVISIYHESLLNDIFGLGPGHTVGRLGGWMLVDYAHILNPLGATIHPASADVWSEISNLFWNDSPGSLTSIFSPFWGWAGIWGDLGWAGLSAYFYLGYLIWRYLARDTLSQILVIKVFLLGFIFTQIEEPGFMLFAAMMLGLKWHEYRLNLLKKRLCI